MRMSKAFPIKMAFYTLVVGYLWLDLFVMKGPLSERLKRVNPQSEVNVAFAKEKGVAARVYHQPIFLTQVDYALEEKFWREGKLTDDRGEILKLSSEQLKFRRLAVLQELIDDHLLRIKVRFNAGDLPVSEERVDAAVERFAGRFQSKTELLAAIRGQGWEDERELRSRLAARIQRLDYLEKVILEEVTEEEARVWYEENREDLKRPKRRRLRQVFLAITDFKAEEGVKLIGEIEEKVKAGEMSFEEAVEQYSGDPNSKAKSGELGWVAKGRLPQSFAGEVFSLPVGEPTVMQTHLGWHLMEVLEERAEEGRSFEDCREEIKAAMEATRSEVGLRRYLEQLRVSQKDKVEVFQEVLVRPFSFEPQMNAD